MYEAALLPEAERRDMCIGLLEEFGVTHIHETKKGELQHSCVLPFGLHAHGDSSPSASLNYRKLAFKCLSCGSGGSLLWFIATMRGTDTKTARSWITKSAGIGQVMETADLMRYFDLIYRPKDKPSPPPCYSSNILRPWRKIHPYLTEVREIPESTIKQFQLGYDEHYQVFPKTDIKSAEYAEAIIIPHFLGEQLVGWQARRLDGGKPKYKNSPDFPKDSTLFNYDYLNEVAVIVESPMSVLRHYHHLRLVEATFGAAITNEQLRLISKHPKVVLFLDNDPAGWRATEEASAILSRYCNVFVVENPYDADLADMTDHDAEHYITSAVPHSVWSPPARLLCYACKDKACECRGR